MKPETPSLPAALLGAFFAFGASAIATPAAALADDLKLTPLKASSFDIGRKHLVSFFLATDKVCRLTVMIADTMDDDAKDAGAASRLQLVVDPGKSALLDTADGGAATFDCDEDAQAMKVSKIERVAAAPDK